MILYVQNVPQNEGVMFLARLSDGDGVNDFFQITENVISQVTLDCS